jgi:hypothetical protein
MNEELIGYYKALVDENLLTKTQVLFLIQKVTGSWRYNDDGKIDIQGNFLGGGSGMKDLLGIKFGTIKGDFEVCYNMLESMEGFPEVVDGELDLRYNHFKSLKGIPKHVTYSIQLDDSLPVTDISIRRIQALINCRNFPYELALIHEWEGLSQKEKDFLRRDLPNDPDPLIEAHDYGCFNLFSNHRNISQNQC